MTRHVARGTYGPRRKSIQIQRIVVGKSEGTGPPGTPNQTFQDNIKISLREVEWNNAD